MDSFTIQCPKCGWEPDGKPRWGCSVCGKIWNTFSTSGQCPDCLTQYEDTICPQRAGGCGQLSPHLAWYVEVIKPKIKSGSIFSFWKKKDALPPITDKDKRWVEHSLLELATLLESSYFRSLKTITPSKEYFDRIFDGSEEDAKFILHRLVILMNIDAWEITLMFYSNQPTSFSEGIVTTPADGLKDRWKTSSGKYVDNGLGDKEIWIELELLKDIDNLITTMAHELAHYKLLAEHSRQDVDEPLTDLTALAFGFGIFMGNSYFKFEQWHDNTHHGWRMRKSGYLPEQVIAYAMAWLAHYRNEDIYWKDYLNKPMKKYFEQSYKYISQNKEVVKWHLN